jgi:hypothetical protein
MQEAKAKTVNAQNQRRAVYLTFFFLSFAVIDVATMYDFPTLLITGLIADAAMSTFIWFALQIKT